MENNFFWKKSLQDYGATFENTLYIRFDELTIFFIINDMKNEICKWLYKQ